MMRCIAELKDWKDGSAVLAASLNICESWIARVMLKRLAVNTVGSEARGRILARRAAALGTAEVDREPPRHADEPAAEALAVTQVGKSSVGPGERVLGDVLGVLPLTPEGRRRFGGLG